MAAKKPSSGGAGALVAISAVLGAGLIALAVWLHSETTRAEERLDRSKREYREMVDRMKPALTAYLKSGASSKAVSQEDLLTYLSRKATSAKIPAEIFRIQRNQEVKQGGWREQSYTVNLQGAKDAPVSREAVAAFARLVETERPSVRVKNLSLAFAGEDLGSASLTFSAFERDTP
jgi:hypothetical protein